MIDTTKTSDSKLESEKVAISTAIDRTRDEMGKTIEELHGRLNPGVLKDEVLKQFHEAKDTIKTELQANLIEAKESFQAGLIEAKETIKAELTETKQHLAAEVTAGLSEAKVAIQEATIGKVETMIHNTQDSIKTTSRSLVNAIKENPVPSALVGFGLIWLYASGRGKQNSTSSLYGVSNNAQSLGKVIQNKASELAHGAEDMAHRGTSAISEATHSASDALGKLASEAKTSVDRAAHAASDTVNQFAVDTASQSRRLAQRAESTFKGNSLAVGAAIMAVGASVGLAIPSTNTEDEWMGDARDEVFHKAEALASDAFEKVDNAVKQITKGDDQSEEMIVQAGDDKKTQSQDKRPEEGYQNQLNQQDGQAPSNSAPRV